MRFLKATAPFRDSYIYSNLMYGLVSHVTERLAQRSGESLMFEHEGISRLQSEGTEKAHRRQGLGSILVGEAIRLALKTTDGLALPADHVT